MTDYQHVSDTAQNLDAEHFDVFLCHNSEDKPEIRQIADELSRRGIKPWLDERDIQPGQQWQVALEEQIQSIKAAAVFVGKSGISPWQQMEIRTLLNQFVRRACPVIPVILSSATETPELPIFLQNFHWVDFRRTNSDPYQQLIRGIAGEKSPLGREQVSTSLLMESNQDDVVGRLHAPIADQPDEVDRRQLGILRDRVEEYWVDGVLKQSLYHEVLILLGKRTMDEVVERPPWKYDVIDLPDRSRNVLPQEHTINTVFDATGFLLILGEPGSGKTTSLLELTAVLINRAKDDPKERVPIVLNLSSWQRKQALEEWIAAELSAKYRIPGKIAKAWLAKGYLVPLLDGLDEVQSANQPDCVMAINAFIETHNPSGIVVCSRLMEYQWLTRKLKLNSAVCIEPLSPQDVNNFLTAGGPQLAGLQQAMSSDSVLQDLAQTPLMLSIMSLACEGADGKALASHKDVPPQVRREHIFQLYVERMFQRKKSITSPFSHGQAIGWLSWLARKMKEQSQSVFMVEELQPRWLSSLGQQLPYEALAALSIGLLIGLPVGLISGMSFGSGSGLGEGVLVSLLAGLSFLMGCRSISPIKNGIVCGLSSGLMLLLLSSSAASTWVLFGLFVGLVGGLGVGSLMEIRLVETMRWESKHFWGRTVSGAKIGLLIGVVVGFVHFLPRFVSKGVSFWIAAVLGPGFLGWFTLGLFAALTVGLSGGLVDTVRVDKASPNQGVALSLKNGLAVSSLSAISAGLICWLVFSDLSDPLILSLIFSLSIGLSVGLNRGGSAVVKHYSLRLILWLTGVTPLRFIPFLDHCAKLILLKKVGGGYMFIHRSLLEYFTDLSPQGSTVKKVSSGSAL